MLGQGMEPEQYHPIVNMMDKRGMDGFLKGIRGWARLSVIARASALHRSLLQG